MGKNIKPLNKHKRFTSAVLRSFALFVRTLDDNELNEWYCTERNHGERLHKEFSAYLKYKKKQNEK